MTREEAIMHLDYLKDYKTPQQIEAINLAIKALSVTTERSSMVGEWIADDDGDIKCSNCGEYAPLSFDDYYMRGGKIRQEESLLLCPYCGAKMKG